MKLPADYRDKTYRQKVLSSHLISYHVAVQETDLFISSDTDLASHARNSVFRYRHFIETYIDLHPQFLTSLTPLREDALAPTIIREMLHAARLAEVGPMAAVAGTIAQFVGTDLLAHNKNIIVENGGDIFMRTDHPVRIGIFAGASPLSLKVTLLLMPEEMPLGICTSSATVGHSLSFGRADAVCIKAASAALADAAATAVGNLVKKKSDIEMAMQYALQIPGVLGVVIIMGDRMGVTGAIELVE